VLSKFSTSQTCNHHPNQYLRISTSSKPANHRSAKGSKCLTPKKNISCCTLW
jgi:hypothetical protein